VQKFGSTFNLAFSRKLLLPFAGLRPVAVANDEVMSFSMFANLIALLAFQTANHAILNNVQQTAMRRNHHRFIYFRLYLNGDPHNGSARVK
jgi:hypothetical protein